jgi:hypothetical protein
MLLLYAIRYGCWSRIMFSIIFSSMDILKWRNIKSRCYMASLYAISYGCWFCILFSRMLHQWIHYNYCMVKWSWRVVTLMVIINIVKWFWRMYCCAYHSQDSTGEWTGIHGEWREEVERAGWGTKMSGMWMVVWNEGIKEEQKIHYSNSVILLIDISYLVF